MNLIAIDAGNTFWKLGVFIQGELSETFQSEFFEEFIHAIIQLSEKHNVLNYAAISVRNQSVQNQFIEKVVGNWVWLNHASDFPFQIEYKTPETLGLDRVVACAAEFESDQDLLIIDLGSCITYDVVAKNKFKGGAIAPGLNMRFKAMHSFTDNLPEIKFPFNTSELIGNDTQSCLKSGVMNGIRFEIQGMIQEVKKRYPKINVYLTGGDANLFATELNCSIFVRSNMVLKGLYKLYQINAV